MEKKEENNIGEIKEEKEQRLKDELNEITSGKGSEKLEFLKREDIRTMKKDVARLREAEAQKEKERIIAIKAEKEKKKREQKQGKESAGRRKEEETKIIPKEKKSSLPDGPPDGGKKEVKEYEIQLEETLIPTPVKKFSSSKKILVRIVFILFFIALLGLGYWFLNYGKMILEDFLPDTGDFSWQIKKAEIVIPSSFIPIKKTLTYKISDNEEIPNIINELPGNELDQNDFTRIIIENKRKNQLVSLKDIAQGFNLKISQEIIQKLDTDNFNFLIFPQKEGLRGIFLIKIKEKENLLELLQGWEEEIIKEGLFLLNQKVPAIASSFQTFVFLEEKLPIRYLTIAKDDLGICYALFENHLIVSSSLEGIQKAVKDLKTSSSVVLQEKIGQLFIVGFEEKTLTSQFENFFKKYKPGGVLLLSKNIETESQLRRLTENLQKLSIKETGLPLFIAVDQEGGMISRIDFLEEKTAQSEINDTDGAYKIGLKRGEELKSLGVNMNLAPLLDDMEKENFYFDRSFQKTPALSGELAKSLILGQKQAGILTALKHFPGYVNIPFNPEAKLATILTPEISQFKKAMEANPEIVMLANAIYTDIDPSLPLPFSEKGILYLKANLGNEVLTLSDDLAQTSLLEKFSLKEIVKKPIEAGVDILIFSGWKIPVAQAIDTFFEMVINKEISEAKIDTAVSRIIKLKQNLK